MKTNSRLAARGLILASVALLLATVALSLAPDSALAAHPTPQPSTSTEIAQGTSSEQELVEKYAPILYLREQSRDCGGGEPFDPGPVSLVLDQPGVFLRQLVADENTALESPGASDIFDKGEDYYLDWPGNPRRPKCDYETDYRELRGDSDPLIYAHIATEEGYDGIAVQYFFFYYYNDFLNKHEGDWEKIQIAFEADSIEEALAEGPDRVAYAGHAGGERADWDSNKLQREDGRPVVYVAQGAHASYLDDARYLGVGREGTVFGCEEVRPPHRRVDPKVQLLPEEVTDANGDFAWLEYKGLWGEYQKSGLYRGISGPKQAELWSHPFSWEENVRSWSERLPETETLGLDPLDPFCFLAARGSALLNLAHENPFTVGGGTALLIAVAFGLLIVGVPQRTFGSQSPTRPDTYQPIVFRRKRNLGQIGRAAFVLYRRNFPLFIMIGGVFIVLGTLASSVQGPLVLRDLVDSPFAEPILVITTGSLQAIVALLLIEASFTVALKHMADGFSPSFRDVYRGVFNRFWKVVGARLWASLHVVALAISIVGLPWAVHRSVCWLFVEQEAIFENQQPGEALTSSRLLVKGSWLRTLGFITVSAILLVLPGPIIGLGMLLFASPPASDTVYLVNGLLYGLLLAPIFAVCKVLFFFDLISPDEPIAE
jgi:hypothetical protein